ncbi:helix-turn-helix transcriptional regulator [Dactylosporangium sp. NPDC005572]|uniref:helix-turn-helix domain-containing protein n=1 Tax=Dactylosporangium sp. NPDC005572 TaxID=3156889 RepID=UPI0033ACE6E2
MARRPSTLTLHVSARHFLGAELRRWRELRGLSLAELAGAVFVSPDLVSKVEKAQRTATATAALIDACDAVLDTGVALARLLDFAAHQERAAGPRRKPGAETAPLPPPVSITVTVTADVTPLTTISGTAESAAAGPGDARIYRFPPSSTRRGRS